MNKKKVLLEDGTKNGCGWSGCLWSKLCACWRIWCGYIMWGKHGYPTKSGIPGRDMEIPGISRYTALGLFTRMSSMKKEVGLAEERVSEKCDAFIFGPSSFGWNLKKTPLTFYDFLKTEYDDSRKDSNI